MGIWDNETSIRQTKNIMATAGKKMIKKGSIARENRNAGTVSLLSILIRVSFRSLIFDFWPIFGAKFWFTIFNFTKKETA